ncbi:MAG: aldo/keto reductase [Polyangia bacterium]|jgi:aryl-alcohol dehydrogenase-like predicted oxidoreductase
MSDWLYRTPTAFHGKKLHRLGLACSYGIDEDGVRAGMDRGVNFFLWTMKNKAMRAPLGDAFKNRRDQVAVIGYATLGFFGWGVRHSCESLLKELKLDYLDVYLLGWLGVTTAYTAATEKELIHLRESGKVRAIGCSIHNRERAGKLAAESPLDLLMIRYNAAHPGAERDIFPHVKAQKPSILAYTATRWGKLLKRPSGYDGPVMTAGDCYRFQLSNPHVDIALTGPASRAELIQNLDALDKGPLTPEEDAWMRSFGKKVHG